VTPISVEYNVTPRERTEGRSALIPTAAAIRKRQGWKGLIGWVLFLLLAVLFFLMMMQNEGRLGGGRAPPRPVETEKPAQEDPRVHRLRLIAVAVCVASAPVFVAVMWVSFVFVRREQRRRDAGLGRYRTRYAFTEDALVETAGSKTTFLYWPAFRSFAETQALFVIRNTPDQGPVIPKRLFASEAEVGAVRELLVRKLTPPPVPQDAPPPLPPPSPEVR
jgi:hypothetical protein